jgi:hypothetical protein
MKAENDLSLWSIIERMQRRLERQGMPPATADRALSLALRQLATTKRQLFGVFLGRDTWRLA